VLVARQEPCRRLKAQGTSSSQEQICGPVSGLAMSEPRIGQQEGRGRVNRSRVGDRPTRTVTWRRPNKCLGTSRQISILCRSACRCYHRAARGERGRWRRVSNRLIANKDFAKIVRESGSEEARRAAWSDIHERTQFARSIRGDLERSGCTRRHQRDSHVYWCYHAGWHLQTAGLSSCLCLSHRDGADFIFPRRCNGDSWVRDRRVVP